MSADRAAATPKIRPARRGDADGILRLLTSAGASTDPSTVTWIVSHPEIEMWVAVDALDKVQGVVTMSHRPRLSAAGRVAVVEELVVAQEFRRQGLGSALLKTAISRAQVLTVKRVEVLGAAAPDEDPETLLQGLGFKRAASLWSVGQ